MIKPQKFTSRLASIEKVSSNVYLKRFALVTPREIDFVPGQTVMLQVVPGVNRSMSIASPPSEKTSIFVAHDVSPMGPYSQWTIKARVGDTMNFIGPLGVFVLDAKSPRKKVFIATGTGVSPFRAMLLEQLSSNNELNAEYTNNTQNINSYIRTNSLFVDEKGPRPFALYWGLRREEDIFWQKEFEGLAAKHPNFRFVLTLSQASDTWQGKRGRVGDHVFVDEQNLLACDFYLCGNRQMVSEMEGRLLTAGVPKEQVKKELFY